LKKYEFIDSLRGIAILGVIFVHTSKSITSLNPILLSVCNFGKHGVQLFFLLSAYTLCLSNQNRRSEFNSKTKYFIRRFFRIAPLYYFGIGLYGIVFILRNYYGVETYLLTTKYSTLSVIQHLTFTQSLSQDSIFAVVPGGWSIGAEMLFYLMFPFLFDIFSKLSSMAFLFLIPFLALVIVFVFFRALPHIFPPLSDHNFNFYYCTILNQIPIFLIGISFFFLSSNTIVKSSTGWLFLIIFILTIGILNILYFKQIRDISLFPFTVALSMTFLISAFRSLAFLNVKPLQLIGRLSYSIYLFHFIFAWGLSSYINKNLSPYLNSSFILVICLFVVIFCSIIMATLTKHLIEDKGIALGNTIINKFIKPQNA
jgi:peptidoglycan/LPS O-acetylase OafA/YrhL